MRTMLVCIPPLAEIAATLNQLHIEAVAGFQEAPEGSDERRDWSALRLYLARATSAVEGAQKHIEKRADVSAFLEKP